MYMSLFRFRTHALNRAVVRLGSKISRLWFNLGILVSVPAMVIAPVVMVMNLFQVVASITHMQAASESASVCTNA